MCTTLGNLPHVWHWVPTMTRALISYSGQNPYIAGFYRILTTFIKVAERAQFFVDFGNVAATHVVATPLQKPGVSEEDMMMDIDAPVLVVDAQEATLTVTLALKRLGGKKVDIIVLP